MVPTKHDAGDAAKEKQERPRNGCWAWTECMIGTLWVLIFLAFIFMLIWYGPTAIREKLLDMVPHHPGWGWFGTLCLTTCLGIVFLTPFPLPLMMFTGLLFGLFWGFVNNFVAVWVAAVASMAVGRMFLRERIRGWLTEGDSKRIKTMLAVLEDEDNSITFLCLFRFLLSPFFVKNYGTATLDIPLWKLYVSAIPHTVWMSLICSSLGASLKDRSEIKGEGEGWTRWQEIAVFCVSIIATCLISAYAYLKYNEKMRQCEAQGILEAPPVPAEAARGATTV